MSAPGFVDLHSHLIPGVDDGARNLGAALEALRAMRDEGVVRAVTTPHFDAELSERPELMELRLAHIDAAWETLRAAAIREVPGIELARGLEVMLDIPSFQPDDPRLRLAGSSAVLIEFPRVQLPPGTSDALYRLRLAGWTPVIAHPERYVQVAEIELVEEWRRVGACTMVNAGSVVGDLRQGSVRVARELFRAGLVDMIGSDFHARRERPLHLLAAARRVEAVAGEDAVSLLFHVNPLRALAGEEMLDVQRFDPIPSLLGRVMRRLRAG
jgi:protein-tyrosine phosphatase